MGSYGGCEVSGERSEEDRHDEMLSRVTERLNEGENCMRWEQLLLSVTDNEMTIILQTINGRLENALKGSEDIEGLILVGGAEMIASRIIQAYIYAVKKEVRAALEVINDTMVLLGECVDGHRIPEGYLCLSDRAGVPRMEAL